MRYKKPYECLCYCARKLDQYMRKRIPTSLSHVEYGPMFYYNDEIMNARKQWLIKDKLSN